MISPSETANRKLHSSVVTTDVPVRLLNADTRSVSRLEFHSSERIELAAGTEIDEEEIVLKGDTAVPDARPESLEQKSTEIEMARNNAKAEARIEWQQELETKIIEERALILKVCEEFRRERARYFAGVEGEVVKLSLAIATRVLHRETVIDPMLLAGVVRVALEKLAGASDVVLRVPADTVERWRTGLLVNPEISIQIVADERMSVGDCVLETNVGKVEFGVSTQLEEIERGFFDLLQQRPS